MRAELGAFAADGVLALAGLCILWGLGVLGRSARSFLAALGLAYLTGSAVVCVALIALLSAGAPFGVTTFLGVAALCVVAGLGAGLRREGNARPRLPRLHLRVPAAPRLRGRSLGWWITAIFVVLFGVYALVGLLNALLLPLDQQDAWSIWTRKAQLLTVNDTLPSEFFTSESYAFMHPDYPLLLPVWEALHFRTAGRIDTQAVHAHLWLLLPAFVGAAAYLVRDVMGPLIWAPILLGVGAAPGVWQQLLWAFADLPMALFAGVGALCLGLWLTRGRGSDLVLSGVMLAAAASTKNEGLMSAAALLLVAAIVVLATRRSQALPFARRRSEALPSTRGRSQALGLGLTALGVVVALLPWRIWMAAHGVAGELPVLKGLDPGYLLDRTERVMPAVRAINAQLARQEQWVYLVPLAVLVAGASLVAGVNRRAAALYLGAGAIMWGLLVWAYWIYPLDLTFLLTTSPDRVITGLIFVCVAAVLHLTGGLAALAARTWADPRGR